MRRKEKHYSKARDETDDVVQLIQQSADEWSCTKEALISKLMQLKSINEDTAKANIDCALCLGAIVVLHRGGVDKPILMDVATLRRERSLCSKTDLDQVVLTTLTELGARSRASSCSSPEIVAHIRLTYDVKSKLFDSLHAAVQWELDALHKQQTISTTAGGPAAMSYFLSAVADKKTIKANGYCNGAATAECLPSTSSVHLSEMSNSLSLKVKRNSRVAAKKDPPGGTAGGKGELRQLQDSLSQFFTPSSVRRSRLSSLGNMSADGGFRRSAEKQDAEESKPLNKVLQIVIDERSAELPAPLTTSSDASERSTGGKTGSSATTPSPHRRGDQLQDALSFYFSASSDRRKRHEKGEYLVMSNGVTPRRKMDSTEEAPTPHPRVDPINDEKEIKVVKVEPAGSQQRNVSPTRAALRSPKSPSAAVVKQRRASLRRFSATTAAIGGGVRKRAQLTTRSSVFAKRKANKLLKNAKGAFRPTSNSELSTASNSPKKSLNAHFKGESAPVTINRLKSSPIKSSNASPFKAYNPPELKHTESGWEIPDENRKMFDQARELAQQDLQDSCLQMITAENPNQAYPARIKISNYEIDSWYSSPYPQEYVMLPILYICESCLTYVADEAPHARKCTARFPPGNEIYRQNNVSVFEVDGNLARVYCRNLCLLAKLFIDHKTLYFDVEPFLFYVLTINDERGNHFVGYFSKEKFSSQKYNLACIVTLPCYQGGGYGRFLIDFSYLLSRNENMLGTPERPLSELGRIAYQSYWRSAILEELYRSVTESIDKSLSINDLSQRTGITLHDVLDTLLSNNLLRVNNNVVCLSINMQQLKRHWDRAKNSKSRIWMDESCLRWSPKQYSPSKEFPIRSPTQTTAPIEFTAIKEEDVVVEKIKRRGKRKLVLEEPAESMVGRQRKSSVKANLRRKQMEEEFLSEDDDDEFNTSKLVSCKDDVAQKNNYRKTPSTDDELPGGEKQPTASRSSHHAGAEMPKTTIGRAQKSQRNSRGTTRRESKKPPSITDASDSDEDAHDSDKTNSKAATPKVETNRIYSTTECEDNNSDSSAYGEPKRKTSGYQRRKQLTGTRGGKPRVTAGLKGKRAAAEKKPDIENASPINSPNEETTGRKKGKIVTAIASSSSSSYGSDSEKSVKATPKIAEKPAKKTPKKPHNNNRKRSTACRNGTARSRSNRYGSDVDEDICTASSVSSMSPQPLDDHHLLALKCANGNNEPDTINMGGEPDIINMGGEPDEDIASVPTMMNVLSPNSPKAPLAPPANVVVEEEEPTEDDAHTVGFFSHQTTSNRSALGSSQVSFEQTLSHRSYDNATADDFHGPSYQHVLQPPQQQPQEYDNGPFGQQTVTAAFHGNNYAAFNVPTTSTLAASYAANNKFDDVSPSSYTNNNPTFYSHHAQMQQQSHCFAMTGGEEAKSLVGVYPTTQLQNMCGSNGKDDSTTAMIEDKGESDMPVLDARTTPRTSPSLAHMEEIMANQMEPNNSDDEDDDAPPQLSPNVPSNDVQPISPDDGMAAATRMASDEALESSSISNNSMANASYESSKSSVHSMKAGDSAVEPRGSPPSPAANQFSGKFNAPALLLPQQPANFSAYDFQCATNQFSAAEFSTQIGADCTKSPLSSAHESASADDNILQGKHADYEKVNGDMYSGSTAAVLTGSNKPPALLAPLNISPPNAAHAAGNGALLRNDISSPQEQRSAPPNLLQGQSATDLGMYPQSAHLSNATLVISDGIKAADPNEVYPSASTGYLPSTLTVPQQQTRSSSATGAPKKSKRSTAKESKEKPVKVSKRVKSSENSETAAQSATAAKMQEAMPNFPQFMNGAFAPDYMSMAAAAQFAMTNGSVSGLPGGPMPITNPLSGMPGGGTYYPPTAAASGYFNAAAIAANSGYPYHAMSQSFYNNAAAWQQYYGFYANNQYPMLNGVANAQQQSAAFRTGTPDGGTGPAAIRGRSASTATPAVMGAQQPVDIAEQQRSMSSGGANAVGASSWSPAMMAFGLPVGAPHVAGSVPTANYPMNMHPAYSSYSTHT